MLGFEVSEFASWWKSSLFWFDHWNHYKFWFLLNPSLYSYLYNLSNSFLYCVFTCFFINSFILYIHKNPLSKIIILLLLISATEYYKTPDNCEKKKAWQLKFNMIKTENIYKHNILIWLLIVKVYTYTLNGRFVKVIFLLFMLILYLCERNFFYLN